MYIVTSITPSRLSIFLPGPDMANKSMKTLAKIFTTKSILAPGYVGIGLINDEVPSMNSTLKTFEPTTLPMAISGLFL